MLKNKTMVPNICMVAFLTERQRYSIYPYLARFSDDFNINALPFFALYYSSFPNWLKSFDDFISSLSRGFLKDRFMPIKYHRQLQVLIVDCELSDV